METGGRGLLIVRTGLGGFIFIATDAQSSTDKVSVFFRVICGNKKIAVLVLGFKFAVLESVTPTMGLQTPSPGLETLTNGIETLSLGLQTATWGLRTESSGWLFLKKKSLHEPLES